MCVPGETSGDEGPTYNWTQSVPSVSPADPVSSETRRPDSSRDEPFSAAKTASQLNCHNVASGTVMKRRPRVVRNSSTRSLSYIDRYYTKARIALNATPMTELRDVT